VPEEAPRKPARGARLETKIERAATLLASSSWEERKKRRKKKEEEQSMIEPSQLPLALSSQLPLLLA